MKKTILLAATLGLILFYGASHVTAQEGECRSMSIPTCQAGTRITINNNGNTVAPPNLCVAPGESSSRPIVEPTTTTCTSATAAASIPASR